MRRAAAVLRGRLSTVATKRRTAASVLNAFASDSAPKRLASASCAAGSLSASAGSGFAGGGASGIGCWIVGAFGPSAGAGARRRRDGRRWRGWHLARGLPVIERTDAGGDEHRDPQERTFHRATLRGRIGPGSAAIGCVVAHNVGHPEEPSHGLSIDSRSPRRSRGHRVHRRRGRSRGTPRRRACGRPTSLRRASSRRSRRRCFPIRSSSTACATRDRRRRARRRGSGKPRRGTRSPMRSGRAPAGAAIDAAIVHARHADLVVLGATAAPDSRAISCMPS